MSETRIPKKITPDPILDSTVECRFKSTIPKEDIIPGFVKLFLDVFPKFKEGVAPPFDNFPTDHLSKISLLNDSFLIGFGTRVIVFGCVGGYKGWESFSKMIYENLEKALSSRLIDSVERIGVRYINFFKDVPDLSRNINLDISFAGKERFGEIKGTQFRTQVTKEGLNLTLLLVDEAAANNQKGSILDIDAYSDNLKMSSFSDIKAKIEECKVEENELFFTLLKSEFLEKFKPEFKE